MARARSPVPVARSTIFFALQLATISAERFRQWKSNPQLKMWFARSYRREIAPNIARTFTGSREPDTKLSSIGLRTEPLSCRFLAKARPGRSQAMRPGRHEVVA